MCPNPLAVIAAMALRLLIARIRMPAQKLRRALLIHPAGTDDAYEVLGLAAFTQIFGDRSAMTDLSYL